MSAIAHEAPIYERPDRRAHLVLVPTGPDAGRAGGAAATEPPLRLTRLGRLVIAVVIATAVALLGVGLAGQLATAGAALRAVTVVSGDTLSDIAARELPGLPDRRRRDRDPARQRAVHRPDQRRPGARHPDAMTG